MPAELNWYEKSDEAKALAAKERKPVLILFERHDCGGCRAMERTTFTDEDVINFLGEKFIPLRLDIFRDKKDRSDFSAYWTPSFHVADHNGKQFFRFEGYYNSADFLMKLRTGLTEYMIPKGRYDEALLLQESVTAKEKESPLYPGFTVYRGKLVLLKTGKSDVIKDIMGKLRDKNPGSIEARQYFWDI